MRIKMNRTIKFRGKSADNGKWITGCYYHECGNTYIVEDRQSLSETSRNVPYVVIPETVGQFTGLFDKNGKEIYEGDIIKGFDITIEVWYSEDKACFMAEMKEPQNDMVDILGGYDTARMEIIGNIYDNPELIKEE